MNRTYVQTLWEELRLIQGVTFRIIDQVPKDKIDVRPIKDMRTPKELVAHMYQTMRCVSEGVIKGQVVDDENADKGVNLKSHEDLVRFAEESWKAADKAIQSATDAQLAAMVKTNWGQDFPGWICVQIIFDEHLHHRGQLYAFLRALGIEPVFMWDFMNSAPQFRPRQHQPA